MAPEISEEDLTRLQNAAQAGTDAANALDAATQREAAAVEALAGQLRAANPDLPADAIAGANADELTASVTRARSIATHAAEHAAANAPPPPAATPPPATAAQASAPPRTETSEPHGLRGAARIRYGLDKAAKKEPA